MNTAELRARGAELRKRTAALPKGEFRQFIGMARGSVFELQTQLEIARQLSFGKEALRRAAESLAEETGKMTWALMQKL